MLNLETYATVEEADAILGETSPWEDADPDEKIMALQMARVYVDSNYVINFVEATEIPGSVKIGNAYLANEHLLSDIFSRQNTEGSLSEKTVKASSVTTTKKFDTSRIKKWIDPFKKVTSIMRPFCVLSSGRSIRSVPLIRR